MNTGIAAFMLLRGIVVTNLNKCKGPVWTSLFLTTALTSAVTTAQDHLTESTSGTKQSGSSSKYTDGIDETIVVTGTRIQRDAFSTPTPLTVVNTELIEDSGFTGIEDVLLRVPSIGVGLGSTNGFQNFDAGAAFISLRGLGTNRSLTLVNGRRRVSGSSQSSAVDLNTIPADMIERVEIITGGVSAIYGADAVSGVVNVITKKKPEGISFNYRGAISGESDAEQTAISLFGGTAFANDKGNITFGANYSDQAELMMLDRDFGERQQFNWANPANTSPNDGITDNRTITDFRLPYITNDVNFYFPGATPEEERYFVWTENGLRQLELGERFRPGPFGFYNGGEGATQTEPLQLRSPVETYSFRTEINYELASEVNFFTEAEFTATESAVNDEFLRYDERSGWFSGRGGPRIQFDNPFLPQELEDLLVANGFTEGLARKQSEVELGFRKNIHERQTYTLLGGLTGKFTNDWNWETFYQYGEYNDDIQSTNRVIASRYLNAVDVISDPVTGEPICRSAEARADGCVPYNIFVKVPFTQAQRDYFVHTRLQNVLNTQKVYGGQITGNAFELPAGTLSFAVGFEHREESLRTRDDGIILSGEATHDDTFPRPPVDADFDVTEYFGEVLIPVISDIALIQQLDIEMAVRQSDYSSIGNTTAYRFGANWTLNDDLRFRFTHAQSVRAPNLIELNSPQVSSFLSIPDACDASRVDANANRQTNCAAAGYDPTWTETGEVSPVTSGGNPDLTEETSDSFTVGVIYTPEWIEGLSLSLDYYDIEIEDAVSNFGAFEVADRCFDASSLDNIFCDRLTFAANEDISEVDVSSINVSELATSGVDFAIQYNRSLGRYGTLGLGLNGTYLIEKEELVVKNDPASLVITDGEFTDPELRFNFVVDYQYDDFTLAMVNRYIDESVIDRQADPEEFDKDVVSRRIYTDLSARYQLMDNISLTLGVNNLFDRDPPQTFATHLGGATIRSPGVFYDNIGQAFHFGFRAEFD